MTDTQERTRTERPAVVTQSAPDSLLGRLAAWSHDHRWWVLAIWIVGPFKGGPGTQGW